MQEMCIINNVLFIGGFFMLLEQINSDLLTLAKESDTVLHDIYEKIDSICLINSNRCLLYTSRCV